MGKELKNEFSWSKTRDEAFRECLRRYYFQYYGSWGGWDRNAPARVRELYILKNLQTRQMWAGDHVHRRIESVLGALRLGKEPPTADAAAEMTLSDMREDFKKSRSGAYRQNPKKVCGLFEHEYQQEIPNEVWKQNADHVVSCLRNFYTSDTFAEIRATPVPGWLELEERAIFLLDGIRVFVQLDFALRKGDEIVLYDWKTGRADAGRNDLQLACYVLYAAGRWKAPPAQITAVEFNLPNNIVTRLQLTQEQLDEIKEYIRDSADEMLFPLSDPENNIAEEDSFDFTEDDRACRRCNFLKLCPKWQNDG